MRKMFRSCALQVAFLAMISVSAAAMPFSILDGMNSLAAPFSMQLSSWEPIVDEPVEGWSLPMVSPAGLPPGALPADDGGFAISPESIAIPPIGGYQWITQEMYDSDWLAFMLWSNSRLLTNTNTGGGGAPFIPNNPPPPDNPPSGPGPTDPSFTSVPEPGGVCSLLIGGVLLVLTRRRA